jgi:hypothetical protein
MIAMVAAKDPVRPPIPNSSKTKYTGIRCGNQAAAIEITSPKRRPNALIARSGFRPYTSDSFPILGLLMAQPMPEMICAHIMNRPILA